MAAPPLAVAATAARAAVSSAGGALEVAELAVFGAAELDEEDELLVAVAMAAGFTDDALFEDAACAALIAS